ncbi:MAG: dockerin type I domain-containing protein, partial [Saprospiraceae bacterium]
GIVLTCDDLGTVIVRIYAWDSAFNPYAVQPDGTVGGPNFDWCETYILVQDNMFNLCDTGQGRIAGLIATEEQEPVAEVEVNLSGLMSGNMNTPLAGTYTFDNLTTGPQADYTVAPELDAVPLNGVSTFDLVLISRHILSVEPLNSPYKLIAADVNNDKKITTIDLIHLRKLILAIDTEFANNTSWRFVRADYIFPVPTDPWFEVFPEVYNVNDLTGEINDADFVAVKIGDVNSSAATSFASIEPRTIEGLFALEVEDQKLIAGNEYTVTFKASEIAKIQGYQGTLTLNQAAVELVNMEYGAVKEDNFGMRYAAEGMITTSWNGEATKDDVLFSLVLRAKTDASLSEVLGVSSSYTVAEAYRQNGALLDLGIRFSSGVLASGAVVLEQNTPNPFGERTTIGFTLPASASTLASTLASTPLSQRLSQRSEAQEVTLTITDAQGRVVKLFRGNYGPGRHTQELEAKDLPAGMLFYTLRVGNFSATRGMIVQE